MLVYLVAVWNILWIFGIFYENSVHCVHLVHFSSFGIMHQEKSGNLAVHQDLTGGQLSKAQIFFLKMKENKNTFHISRKGIRTMYAIFVVSS
jgi:hypothetical protein